MTDIVTLTPDPAVDITTSVEKIVPVNKLRCTPQLRDPGGGGVNVARVVKRLGSDVLAVYPIGGATGELLRRLVERENVPSRTSTIAEETREDFSVTEISSGQQYRFVLPGPQLNEAEWHECLDLIDKIEPFPRFLVASRKSAARGPRRLLCQSCPDRKAAGRQDGSRHLRSAVCGGCRGRSRYRQTKSRESWLSSPACSCPMRNNGKKRRGAL